VSSPRSDLTPLRLLWLALALAGAALALGQHETMWQGIRTAEIVAQVTLGLWCMIETMVRRNWLAFLTFPALALGIGCALPLYLFIRSRRIT